MNKELITSLYNIRFKYIDVHFGKFVAACGANADDDVFLAAAMVSRFTREGDVCLDLRRWSGQAIEQETNPSRPVTCPELKAWRRKLVNHPMVGQPLEFRPLILDERDRLYLHRYWEYETMLGQALLARARDNATEIDSTVLRADLRRLLDRNANRLNHEQVLAAIIALMKRICVISGGPGTGKTFTIATILRCFLAQNKGRQDRLWLAAPTGKAAARLLEAVKVNVKKLPAEDDFAHLFPNQAYTLHRMLQPQPNSPYFFYSADRHLPADAVIVDEASMVDLPLMTKLVQALPPTAHLILCGDKDQLASVEAGAILADLCAGQSRNRFSPSLADRIDDLSAKRLADAYQRTETHDPLGDCRVFLHRTYRFARQSGIHRVSRQANKGHWQKVLQLLKAGDDPTIDWLPIVSLGKLYQALAKIAVERYRSLFSTQEPQAALDILNRFKVLCAVRQGPCGLHAINHRIEAHLTTAGLIQRVDRQRWYVGRPILILRNRPELELYNGDMGVVLPARGGDPTDLRVYFQGYDGEPRAFVPASLPEHETAYAMTVHKSQGSEFQDIALILPRSDSPVLTRELLYTGITRARRHMSIWSSEAALVQTIKRRSARASGLRDRLLCHTR